MITILRRFLSFGALCVGLALSARVLCAQGAPVITVQPADQIGYVAGVVRFEVAATGAAPLAYRWQKDGADIAGATDAALRLPELAATSAGVYRAVISNAAGAVTSRAATLAIHRMELDATRRVDVFSPAANAVTGLLPRAGGGFYLSGSFDAIEGRPTAPLVRLSDAGVPDPTFVPAVVGVPLLELPDGRLLIGRTPGSSSIIELVVLRPEGTVDSGFSASVGGNTSLTDFRAQLTTGGAIILAGSFSSVNGLPRPGLARLRADGVLESAYAPTVVSRAAAVLPDGRAFVSTGENVIVRLLANGDVDATFAPVKHVGGGSLRPYPSLWALADGGLLVSGLNEVQAAGVEKVARYKSDGAPDLAYTSPAVLSGSGAGLTLAVAPDGSALAWALSRLHRVSPTGVAEVLSDDWTFGGGVLDRAWTLPQGGFIVAGASFAFSAIAPSHLRRISAAGAVDRSFVVGLGVTGGVEWQAATPGGQTYLAGAFAWVGGDRRIGLARLTAEGGVDASYTPPATLVEGFQLRVLLTDGAVLLGHGRYSGGNLLWRRVEWDGAVDIAKDLVFTSLVLAVSAAPEGAAFFGGSALAVNGTQRSAITRVWPGGAGSDASFRPSPPPGEITHLVHAPDGRFAAVCSLAQSSTGRLVWYLPDGRLDATRNPINFQGYVTAVRMATDGTLFVAGSLSFFGGAERGPIIKISPAGNVDETFRSVFGVRAGDAAAASPNWTIFSDGRQSFVGFVSDAEGYRNIWLTPWGEQDLGFAPVLVPMSWDGGNSSGSLAAFTATGTFKSAEGAVRHGLAHYRDPAALRVTFPSPVEVCAPGSDATLWVAVSGLSGPPTFEWRRDGVVVVGATGRELRLPAVTTAQSGRYFVRVWGDGQSVDAGPIQLHIAQGPLLLREPTALAAAQGGAAELTVGAVGVAPLTYQWQRNGVDVPGATSAVLRFATLRSADAGDYRVIVRDAAASATSASVPVVLESWRIDESYRPVFGYLPTGSGFTEPPLVTALGLPDGRTMVAGNFSVVDGVSRPYIARLDAAGQIDPIFTLAVGVPGPITRLWRRADGRLLVRGTSIALLTADGQIDPSFALDPAVPEVFAAELLGDGKIDIVFGRVGQSRLGSYSRGRLLSDGRLDPAILVTTTEVNTLPDSRLAVTLLGGGVLRIAGLDRLERLRADGTVDTAYVAPLLSAGRLRTLHTDNSGRIYLSGDFSQCDHRVAHGIVRLNPDGTFERGFDSHTGGTWLITAVAGEGRVLARSPITSQYIWLSSALEFAGLFLPELRNSTNVSSVSPLGDGRAYVVAKGVELNGEAFPAQTILRLDAAGRRDPTFSAPTFNNGISQLFPLASGKLIVVGSFFVQTPTKFIYSALRLNADGSVDPTWNASVSGLQSATVDAQGRLIFANSMTLLRLRTDGTVDPSFVPPSFASYTVAVIATTADHRVLIVASLPGQTGNVSLMRLNENGSLDSTFTSSPFGSGLLDYGVVQLSDGRFVRHSRYFSPFSSPIAVLRIDGTVDSAPVLQPDGAVLQVLPLVEGGYLLSGAFTMVNGVSRQRLARVKADGTLDDGFQIAGPPATYESGSFSRRFGLAAASAGEVLVSGDFTVLSGIRAHHLARITTAPFDVRPNSARIVVAPGAAASLGVEATGRGPFSYQWKKAGVQITSANAATLAIPTVTLADAGDYVCEVTAAGVTRTSAPQTLAVGRAPRITVPPVSPLVVPSTGATLAVTAESDSPPSFAWYVNGTRRAADESSSIAISPAGIYRSVESGLYEVRASNPFGTTRAASTVLAGYAPSISSQPAALTASAGHRAVLQFTYAGSHTPLVRWYRDGQLVGARAQVSFNGSQISLIFPELRPEDSGSYTATVETPYGSATTSAALLTVVPLPGTGVPVFTLHPVSLLRGPSEGASFSGSATGAASYQWLKDGVPLLGQTTSNFYASYLTSAMAGTYRLQATNSFGSSLSEPATLTLRAPPAIENGPTQPLVPLPGAQVVLKAKVTTTLPTTYQWMKDDVSVAGATSSTLTLSGITTADAGYYHLVATNAHGTQSGAGHTVTTATAPGYAIMSALGRGQGGLGADEIFATFWVEGTTSKTVLVRALGASLAALGVTGGMPNPRLEILSPSGAVLAANDDWGTSADLDRLRNTMIYSGAVPSFPAAADAAVRVSLTPGVWHVRVRPSSADPRAGLVLCELHDARESSEAGPVSRIAGLTLRTRLGAANDVAVLGFTLPGAYGSAQLVPYLLRAAGPVLGGGGGDPELELYGTSGELVARNRSWQDGASATVLPVQTLGLTPFGSGSGDAAVAATLDQAGPYTLLARAQPGSEGYVVLEAQATDAFRSATRAPAIISPPLPQIATPGGRATFTALWVAAPAPTAFQWSKNGVPLAGATHAVLTLTGVQAADIGDYALTVVSPNGTATGLPAALTLRPPATPHTADTDSDFSFGLYELTRVIELYNTRAGTTRTGAYAVATTATEDGFAPDPLRTGSASSPLARYHAADTNRDGRLSLSELTRVIELFNTRAGTARTGAYHVALTPSTTEDGFAPGP